MKKYFQAPWQLRDLLLVIVIAGILLILASFGLHYIKFEELTEASKYKSIYFIGLFLLQWLVVIVPLLIITKRKYKFRIKDFGFRKIGIPKTIWLVISSYLLFLGITFIISVIILYTDIKIPGYQVQEEILPLFGTTTLDLVIAGITIILIAPIIEEVIFRGFFLRTIANKTGIFWGSIISALIFAVLHIPWQSIIPVFILGLIINRMVINSKSLWPAIVFHILNNSIVFTLEILIAKEVISLESLAILFSG